ncbi:MAG TPA: hypothetical protein PK784_05545 [Tenuifilaceae bacterium]|nr:hypothetical protein [Tenuifilaceae bacterium]
MQQPIYIIIFNGHKYIDFNTILYLLSSLDKDNRSTLWRYLKNNRRIKSAKIKNQKIYLIDDLLSDSFLIGKMQNIQALANALED